MNNFCGLLIDIFNRYHFSLIIRKEKKIMYVSKKWLSLVSILLIVVVITIGCGGGGGAQAETPTPSLAESIGGWTLIPTNIAESPSGDGVMLHVDFVARNDSSEWGSMGAAAPEEKPTVLTTQDGKEYTCDVVQVSSGGHYLPPGFQMRGYIDKKKVEQTLYVECQVAEASTTGARLTIPYTLFVGEYDYYEKGESKVENQFEVELVPSAETLTYPVVSSETEVHSITEEIPALNKCTLVNTGVERTDEGISFQWAVSNPGEYGTLVHIGRPPVLGEDGIIYGARVSPDIVQVPTANPGETAEFETEVEVPRDVGGLYLLLSVEQTRERLFANYLIDLTDLN
jgi:hypothetical protein